MTLTSLVISISIIGVSALGFIKLQEFQQVASKEAEVFTNLMETSQYYDFVTNTDKRCDLIVTDSSASPKVLLTSIGTIQSNIDILYRNKSLFFSNSVLNKTSEIELSLTLLKNIGELTDLDGQTYFQFIAKILFNLKSKTKKLKTLKTDFLTFLYIDKESGLVKFCLELEKNPLNTICHKFGGKIQNNKCELHCLNTDNYIQGIKSGELVCKNLPVY